MPSAIPSACSPGNSVTNEPHRALARTLCTLDPDTCLGVIGLNGVGKSTLLQILAACSYAALGLCWCGSTSPRPPSATWPRRRHTPGASPGPAALYRRTGVSPPSLS